MVRQCEAFYSFPFKKSNSFFKTWFSLSQYSQEWDGDVINIRKFDFNNVKHIYFNRTTLRFFFLIGLVSRNDKL